MSYVSLHGSDVIFYMCMGPDKVMVDIGREGYPMEITYETFDTLYCRLNSELAALKEDCIEYCVYSDQIDPDTYPEWFIQAMYDGYITTGHGVTIFYDRFSEIHIMSPKAVMLRNHWGQIACMTPEVFERYYDVSTIGGYYN